jgi:hypothetical protein
MKKYLNKEWWLKKLPELFPENYGTPEPSWGLNLEFDEFLNTHWFKKDFFLFGITYQGKYQPPIISIRIIGQPTLTVKHPFNMQSADDEFLFIKALACPNLLPLCININHAQPFIEYYYKNAPAFVRGEPTNLF